MTFPNPTQYLLRIEHIINGEFIETKEVIFTDADLTDLQLEFLDLIISRATDRPVCSNCGTSHPLHNVTIRTGGKKLCDTCVELMKITAPERRQRNRRRADRDAVGVQHISETLGANHEPDAGP